jgi:hypothetical protein
MSSTVSGEGGERFGVDQGDPAVGERGGGAGQVRQEPGGAGAAAGISGAEAAVLAQPGLTAHRPVGLEAPAGVEGPELCQPARLEPVDLRPQGG